MKYEILKSIVGVAGNVTVTSELRFSELCFLAKKARSNERGTLTIIVKNGTLCDSEIEALVDEGKEYIRFDFSGL